MVRTAAPLSRATCSMARALNWGSVKMKGTSSASMRSTRLAMEPAAGSSSGPSTTKPRMVSP